MSLISVFLAARAALQNRRRRQRAHADLAALDDRSLADIGLHRSEIPALVERLYDSAPAAVRPSPRRNEARLPAVQQSLRQI